MNIRRAINNDIPAMANLLSELFMIEDDFTIDIEKQSRGLKLLLENDNAIVLVVQEGSDVIGMATVQKLISTAMGEYVGLIEDVVITESYRGRGFGKALLDALVAESKNAGMGRLALGADQRNDKAIVFYKKLGFSTSQMGLMYKM